MRKQILQINSPTVICLVLLLFATETGIIYRFAHGAQRRIQISDDLDDVVDDEEDEAWREWGRKKSAESDFDPPQMDFSTMSPSAIQSEMMKQQSGPVFGFVKLRLGTRRTPEKVSEIAMKWTKLARTGAIEAKFMGVDVSTIMFTMEKGQDTIELKEFLLSQPEAYEVKLGDQLFRRPGDPPFEEAFEKIQTEKSKLDHTSSKEKNRHNEL
ncbi:PREDICTED: uncharacterized protein LOC109231096 [Nicotiana attenuata]|uniref:LDLR chaperone MESD n=1 Tax=Nicotiana attenuata TaxID=49451 RepID=A0A1J6IG04_NICAT|nr:PREDICTED: uncharacterized protein LOC109231096 [Nicotiana attenuata]OIS99463.1 hypothetical protein A4A49_02226 [Nicotiana attenuata]